LLSGEKQKSTKNKKKAANKKAKNNKPQTTKGDLACLPARD
jgi:hypothetical protein